MARWDSPLFIVVEEDPTPPNDQIWDALIGSDGRAKLVKANLATVLVRMSSLTTYFFRLHGQKPATEQNYLYELDKTTSDILAQIMTYQKDHAGEGGGEIGVQDVNKLIELPATPMTLPQLQRIRRQFITLNRQHSFSKARIKEVFVDYLNAEFLR